MAVHPGPAQPQVVVVLGASSGIGLSSARAFATRGAHLVLASRSRQRLEVVATQCLADGAASAVAVETDVNDPVAVDALFDLAAVRHGQLDVVVHTAAVMAYGAVEDIPPEIFQTVVNTSVNGTFLVARAALRRFRAQHRGTLVIVNSLLGAIAAPEMGAYVTGKWAQAGLIHVLQLETRDEPDIHVCSVMPGGVNTPIYSQAANVTGRSARPPLPVDQPEKVARAIVRLADRPRARVSVGLANPITLLGFNLARPVFDALVGPLLHVASLRKPKSTTPSDGNVLAPVASGESERGPWNSKV